MSQHMEKGYLSQVTSKGSCEPAHKRSLARAFAVRRHVVETLKKLQAKKPKQGTAHAYLKNHIPENRKGSFFMCPLI